MRGSLYRAVDQRAGAVAAIALTSVAFALLHVPLYGWAVVPLDLAVGVWLGVLRAVTGSVSRAGARALARRPRRLVAAVTRARARSGRCSPVWSCSRSAGSSRRARHRRSMTASASRTSRTASSCGPRARRRPRRRPRRRASSRSPRGRPPQRACRVRNRRRRSRCSSRPIGCRRRQARSKFVLRATPVHPIAAPSGGHFWSNVYDVEASDPHVTMRDASPPATITLRAATAQRPYPTIERYADGTWTKVDDRAGRQRHLPGDAAGAWAIRRDRIECARRVPAQRRNRRQERRYVDDRCHHCRCRDRSS